MTTLPARMQELRTALEAAGYVTVVTPGTDSVDHPFLTLDALHRATGEKVRATWHTRATGGRSYRLFSCMLSQPYRGWCDLSVAKLLQHLG